MSELEGRIALVTGVGRAEGIGAAICRELAQHGADVFYTYWNAYDSSNYPDKEHKPEEFKKELEALNVRADSQELDLSDPSAPRELFRIASERLGTPTILINNACYDVAMPFTELSAEALDLHYFINLRAVTLMCSEFVKGHQNGKQGNIVNVTSGQSISAMNVDKIPYTVTKAGLEMLAIQLAPGIINLGITINAVDPGPTDTGWMSDEVKKEIQKNSIVNKPEEVATAIAALLLNTGKNTTGQVIHVGR